MIKTYAILNSNKQFVGEAHGNLPKNIAAAKVGEVVTETGKVEGQMERATFLVLEKSIKIEFVQRVRYFNEEHSAEEKKMHTKQQFFTLVKNVESGELLYMSEETF